MLPVAMLTYVLSIVTLLFCYYDLTGNIDISYRHIASNLRQ